MNYSAYIDKLSKVAEDHGFVVCSVATEDYSGRINYKNKTISISEPSAESAMLTLIHEMGHMFHYFRSPNFVDSSSQSHETQAYLYGWAVITKFSLPVSRQVWRQYNRICSNSADALEKMNMSNDQNTAVVMGENEWFKLCAKQCRERRRQHGGTRAECVDEYEGGICAECADDALAAAPAKYRTTPERAANFDPLPGCSS